MAEDGIYKTNISKIILECDSRTINGRKTNFESNNDKTRNHEWSVSVKLCNNSIYLNRKLTQKTEH